jgi:hypothetical protein
VDWSFIAAGEVLRDGLPMSRKGQAARCDAGCPRLLVFALQPRKAANPD